MGTVTSCPSQKQSKDLAVTCHGVPSCVPVLSPPCWGLQVSAVSLGWGHILHPTAAESQEHLPLWGQILPSPPLHLLSTTTSTPSELRCHFQV